MAEGAEAALSLAARIPYDALLVNGKLPGTFGLCDSGVAQEAPLSAAILMYSDEERPPGQGDVILAGLDDFFDPFRPLQQPTTTRIYASLERARQLESGLPGAEELKRGDLRMDVAERRVYNREKEITLTRKEFELLECFMRHPGRVFFS